MYTIIFEIITFSALGFYHMHNSWTRDIKVEIKWENIQTGKKNSFKKYTNNELTQFNTAYDYMSIMHYNSHAFTKNGQPTIVTLVNQHSYYFNRTILVLNAV